MKPRRAAPARARRRGAAAAMSAAAALVLLSLALSAGCASKPRAAAPSPDARAQVLIDAGNSAFHAGDYTLAARRYAAAAVVRRDDPVAWFGLGMALTRLGRDEDARAAYARARELAAAQQRRPRS
jgi:Flp pilus assembly protein TadD